MKDKLAKKIKIYSSDENCPYWSLEKIHECGMTIGGVYLPLPHHVTNFCLSGRYSECQQFIKGCELIMVKEQYDNTNFFVLGDRRKTQRFAERLNVSLAVCNPYCREGQSFGIDAMTLDMSLGGLKLEALQELPVDAIVGFELDPYDASPGFLGVGQVKWCSPRKDSGKYEIGLSFSDDVGTTRAVRKHLRI